MVGAVAVSDITADSAQAVFTVENGDMKDEGIYLCYSTQQEPDMEGNNLEGDGTFLLEGLLPATDYYVRGCAEAGGEYYYGPQSEFTTSEKKPAYLPVSDLHVEKMTGTSAVIKYVLKDSPVHLKETGVCWKEYGDPTVADYSRVGEPTSDGEVTIAIDGLDASSFYTLRAYGLSGEVDVLYSETSTPLYDRSYSPRFTVGEILTKATEASIAYIVSVNRSGWELVQKGVCWTVGGTPTIEDSKTNDGNGLFCVVTEFGGLEPGTLYNMRVYAIVRPTVDKEVIQVTYSEVFEAQTKLQDEKWSK